MIITAWIVKMINLNVVKETRIKTTYYRVRHRQLALLAAFWEERTCSVWQQGRGVQEDKETRLLLALLWYGKAWAHQLIQGVGDWKLQNHDRPHQSTKRLMMTSQKCKQTRSKTKHKHIWTVMLDLVFRDTSVLTSGKSYLSFIKIMF